MAAVGWVDLDKLEEVWPDAPDDMNQVTTALMGSYELCRDYLPEASLTAWDQTVAADPAAVPRTGWILAQVMWAQHLWVRKAAGNNATFGGGGEMSLATWPLVLEAKGLLRPRKPLKGLL